MRWCLPLCLIALVGCTPGLRVTAQPAAVAPAEEVLFDEPFEDTNWQAHGWYDGPQMAITADEHAPGSTQACVWRWAKAGDIAIANRGGRVHLKPVDNVTLSFAIKHSPNWTWTGVNWHPHMFHFVTNVDDQYIGPAYSHLTFYVEAVNGKPRVAIQDGRNIDVGRLGQNLVGVTEQRAVAGGNGDSDGYGNLGHYRNGDLVFNGKTWDPPQVCFSDTPGPRYKGDWHRVKVKFRLNTVKDGIGQRDGVIQYWYDDELLMDYHDVVFRTGQHPTMLINQFLMTPYYGPGVPHPQTIWVDNLRITTERQAAQ
jgi:hypothetical protein